jgi:hypothetical protein
VALEFVGNPALNTDTLQGKFTLTVLAAMIVRIHPVLPGPSKPVTVSRAGAEVFSTHIR